MQDGELAAASSGRVLRPKAAAAYLGEGESTFWSRAKNDPDHPKPFKSGPRIALVFVADCDRYLAKQRAAAAEKVAA